MDGNKTSLPSYLSGRNPSEDSDSDHVLKFLLEEKRRLGDNPYLNLLIEGIRKGSLDAALARDSYEKYMQKEGDRYPDSDAKTRMPSGPIGSFAPSAESSHPSAPVRRESSRNPFAPTESPSRSSAPRSHDDRYSSSSSSPAGAFSGGRPQHNSRNRQRRDLSEQSSPTIHSALFADFDIPEYNVPGGENPHPKRPGMPQERLSIHTLVGSLDENTHGKEDLVGDYGSTRAARFGQPLPPTQFTQPLDPEKYYHETRMPGDFVGYVMQPPHPGLDYERETQANDGMVGSTDLDDAARQARAAGERPVGRESRHHVGGLVGELKTQADAQQPFEGEYFASGYDDAQRFQTDPQAVFTSSVSYRSSHPRANTDTHSNAPTSNSFSISQSSQGFHATSSQPQMTAHISPPAPTDTPQAPTNSEDLYGDDEDTRIIGKNFQDARESTLSEAPPPIERLQDTTERLSFGTFDFEGLFEDIEPMGAEPTDCDEPTGIQPPDGYQIQTEHEISGDIEFTDAEPVQALELSSDVKSRLSQKFHDSTAKSQTNLQPPPNKSGSPRVAPWRVTPVKSEVDEGFVEAPLSAALPKRNHTSLPPLGIQPVDEASLAQPRPTTPKTPPPRPSVPLAGAIPSTPPAPQKQAPPINQRPQHPAGLGLQKPPTSRPMGPRSTTPPLRSDQIPTPSPSPAPSNEALPPSLRPTIMPGQLTPVDPALLEQYSQPSRNRVERRPNTSNPPPLARPQTPPNQHTNPPKPNPVSTRQQLRQRLNLTKSEHSQADHLAARTDTPAHRTTPPSPPAHRPPARPSQNTTISLFYSEECIPVFIVPFSELSQRGINIDHRMAYALSQIDGFCCVRDISDIVGIPTEEMLVTLNELAGKNIVRKK